MFVRMEKMKLIFVKVFFASRFFDNYLHIFCFSLGLELIGDGELPSNSNFYKLLQTRMTDRFEPTDTEITKFKTAIRLFYKRADTHAYNAEQLYKLQKPIRLIKAQHRTYKDYTADRDKYQDCPALLKLAIGAPVRINCNLWTECGLFNGASGHVYDIIDDPNNPDPTALPICVLVRMSSNYKGPSCIPGEKRIVAITPKELCHLNAPSNFSRCRIQIPLSLDWARTIHKAQGMTLPLAVIDISGFNFYFFIYLHSLFFIVHRSRTFCWISSCCIKPYTFPQ